jgi:hypothetical protein
LEEAEREAEEIGLARFATARNDKLAAARTGKQAAARTGMRLTKSDVCFGVARRCCMTRRRVASFADEHK